MSIRQAFDLNSRLYVQLVPDDEARAVLNGIAADLEQKITGRFVTPLKWHITVIHFGKVQEVFTELLAVQPNLSESHFLEALNRFAHRSQTVLPQNIQLETDRFDLFGPRETVFVLRLKPSAEILHAHELAFGYLLDFFRDCNITDVDNFMPNSPNFEHAFDIKPHITMVRRVERVNPDNLMAPQTGLGFLPASLAGI